MTSTISEFVWPRPALADCLTGMVVRDTRGCALEQTQRFNLLPARPFPILSLRFAGEAHVIDQPDQMERPWTGAKLPSLYFFGPQLKPTITWNPGEAYTVGIGFLPGALSAMTGRDLSSFTGRIVPAEEALPHPMLQAYHDFFDAVPREGLERSFLVLQDNIETMWAPVRPTGTGSPFTADWSASLMQRATATGSGRSARQIARRIKSWTGIGQRDLQRFAHIEHLALKRLEATRKGDVDWAALAAASGFSDQAHMIRRTKQQSGFTPEQLRERRAHDEGFWFFRLIDRALDQYLAWPKGQ